MIFAKFAKKWLGGILKKMKIAIFTDSFFPTLGGTERAVLGLANELLAQNHEVAVFCPNHPDAANFQFDFPVYRCPSVGLTANDRMALPRFSRKFQKQIMAFKPDIIHCQSVSGIANAGIRYGVKNNAPVVFTVHTKFRQALMGSIKIKFIVDLYVRIIAKRINKANVVCTVSHDMVEELKKYGVKKPVSVVRNGMMFNREILSEETKNIAIKKYNISSKDVVLLFVGRIVKVKNIDLIFDALKTLNNPGCKMIFAGDGPDLAYFKALAEKQMLSNVVFAGKVSEDELKSLYYNADLFVFPSVFDNDPLVVTEAAIFETPAITLAGTGSAERITNGQDGFIASSPEDFKLLLSKLCSQKELLKPVGMAAAQSIPKTWAQAAEEYLNVYKKLL